MSTPPLPDFRQLVFSGGGIRCFWHGGWMKVAGAALSLTPDRVTGVSGGAMSASAWIAGREADLLNTMVHAFSHNDYNVSLHDLDRDDGLTPHQRIYSEVVDHVLDATAEARIADGPAFQILLAHPTSRLPNTLKALVAGAAYQIEKMVKSRPDGEWAEKVGLTGQLVDARQAARDGRLAQLVKAAATIPPIFRIPEWDGQPVMDGGLINQIPHPDPDEGATLVLMTRDYRDRPEDTARIWHDGPSEAVAGNKIDFTNPDALHAAWDLGERDGQAWLDRHTQSDI